MLQDAAAVIIGSGALGSSVAFHLAKAGVAPVALVDKHEIASQTSPRAAGLTSEIRQSELMTTLAKMAVEKIKNFTAETGEEMIYFQSGSLKIARTAEHEQQLRRDVERGRKLGVDASCGQSWRRAGGRDCYAPSVADHPTYSRCGIPSRHRARDRLQCLHPSCRWRLDVRRLRIRSVATRHGESALGLPYRRFAA